MTHDGAKKAVIASSAQDESEASWRRRFIIQTLQAHQVLEAREPRLEKCLSSHLTTCLLQGKCGIKAPQAT